MPAWASPPHPTAEARGVGERHEAAVAQTGISQTRPARRDAHGMVDPRALLLPLSLPSPALGLPLHVPPKYPVALCPASRAMSVRTRRICILPCAARIPRPQESLRGSDREPQPALPRHKTFPVSMQANDPAAHVHVPAPRHHQAALIHRWKPHTASMAAVSSTCGTE